MELLKQKYNRENYLEFLTDTFNFSQLIQTVSVKSDDVKSFEQLGFITVDGGELPVFEIHIKPNTKLERNRVGLRNLVAKEIHTEDGALAVYIDDDNKLWRFSFIAIEHELNEKKETSSKRFTYLFGEGTQTKTAETRFQLLNKQSTLENLKTAFAVEQLNKDFYGELYKWYDKAKGQVTFPNDEQENNHKETSLIRFLTRILFVWFLKEKQLINKNLFNLKELKKLIIYEQDSSFYKAILQNLFFATLSTEIENRDFRSDKTYHGKNKDHGNQYVYRYQKLVRNKKKWKKLFAQTPFLNGGLFDSLDREATDEDKVKYPSRLENTKIRMEGFSGRPKNPLKFNNQLFFNTEQDLGLIDLFNQYQFTIEESTPADIEVALDPELLGKVFENLLAAYQARKDTGSFYTPREIVSYMVDESLKQHFKTHAKLEEEEKEEQINNLFKGESNLDKKQIKAVITAIDNLKILDPAVGSGAYPMGVLQRLVFILDTIDPENTAFKQQQLDKAEQMEEANKKASIEAIEQIFSKDNQHNTYAKKLMLIESCIYGVDIQPIAIQICKLRFFISLTIEQEKDTTKDNYGIKALPNLETKFIVANTLLPLGKIEASDGMTETIGLFDNEITTLQQDLAKIRHQYFTAKTLKTKRKYKKEDKKLRQKMLETLQQSGISPEVEASMQKVVKWDLYNQNATSDWFDPEWMFGIKDGFDIVIGNPPYIKAEHLEVEDIKVLKNHYFEIKNGKNKHWNDDLYVHFIFKAFSLCREKGIVSYITNDSFIGLQSKERVRDLLYKNNLITLVQCPYETFNASIYTAIFIAQKHVSKNTYFAHKFNHPNYDIKYLGEVNKDITKKLPNKRFVFPDQSLTIYGKSSTGFKLVEMVDILDTGIDSGNVRRKLFFRTSTNTDKQLSNLLQGRHIDNYQLKWAEVDSGYKYCIPNYQPQPIKGIGRGGKPSKKNEYWNFRGDRNNHHLPERLLLRQTDDDLVVAYHNEKEHGHFYTDNTLHTIVLKDKKDSLKFVLALMNSTLLNFLYHFLSQEEGKSMAQVKVGIVKQLPIPEISKSKQKPFINLVNKILSAKKDGKDTTDLETKIDTLVYQLYNLTADEIKIIEGSK